VTGRFRRLFVGSNLKMYKTNRQTLDYLDQLQRLTHDIPRDELTLFILPSYITLADVCRAADPDLVWIGAQNMHWEEQGQFTGEVSPLMLSEIGVRLIMVGHAERRQLFGEEEWMVNRRVLSSLEHGFHTLLCVGDTSDDVRYGVSADRLRLQLKTALYNVPCDQLDRLWVTYEPAWAIGEQGTVAKADFANEMHSVLRQILVDLYPQKNGDVPILYGGSVNLENAVDLICQPQVDGLFIGRAAWDAENYNCILRRILQTA
jgi:triosephosphate isomerase